MKKIVMINSVFDRGSTGKIVKHLAEKAMDEKYDVQVFFGYGQSDKPYAQPIASNLYTKINILKTRLFGKHSFYSKRANKKLIRWIEDFNPDIVHIQQVHGHYLNIPILFTYLKEKNIPVIITLHDCWLFTGHCVHFETAHCYKWQSGCYECPQLKTYPTSWFFDRSKINYKLKKAYFNSIDKLHLATPSRWLNNHLSHSFLSGKDLRVINNGIDVSLFKPNEQSELKDKLGIKDEFVILGMGKKWVQHEKNINTILKSLKIDYKIVLLDIENWFEPNENIICVSRISDQVELAKYYSMADVFVNLTLEDTFPTVNLEALACGTPIVTFDSGGSGEIIDEKTGIVVDQLDFKEVSLAIETIKNSGIDYKTNCIQRAHKLYDKEKCFMQYIDLYNMLLEDKES